MSKRSRSPPPVFKRTVTELENELHRLLIERCKLHACVDVFLIGLYRLLDSAKRPSDFRSHPVKDPERRGQLIQELAANIARLLPGYLPPGSNPLESQTLAEVLGERWRFAIRADPSTQEKRHNGQGGCPSISFEERLVELARNKQLPRICDRLKEDGPRVAEAPKSLKQTALEGDYRIIRDSIKDHGVAGSFVCGGSIPMTRESSSGLTIFWAVSNDSSARKLVLPITDKSPESHARVIWKLARDCSPEQSSSRRKTDVSDTAGRVPGKLETSQFTSNFDPSKHGILGNVEAILLPAILKNQQGSPLARGLRAELYALNVVSDVGFSQKINTTQGPNQIGSLLVCLPSPFKGGGLNVRYDGREVSFNWSEKSGSDIQWAAFCTDCEHEIPAISEGDCIILTYNLIVTESAGPSTSSSDVVDPKSFPLYRVIENLLGQPGFMLQGGIIGIYCSLPYSHTSSAAKRSLPQALKGSDFALYSIFQALRVQDRIRPVLDAEEIGNEDKETTAQNSQTEYLRNGGEIKLEYKEVVPLIDPNETNVDSRWNALLMARQIRGLEQTEEYARENGLKVAGKLRVSPNTQLVGKKLHEYEVVDYVADQHMSDWDMAEEVWPNTCVPDITWLNEPRHVELAFTYALPGVGWDFPPEIESAPSYAAILAAIPP